MKPTLFDDLINLETKDQRWTWIRKSYSETPHVDFLNLSWQETVENFLERLKQRHYTNNKEKIKVTLTKIAESSMAQKFGNPFWHFQKYKKSLKAKGGIKFR